MKRVLSILCCLVCGIASATGIETWRNVAIEGRPALPKKETRSPMTLANAKANVSLFGATSDFSEADAIMRKHLPLDINDDVNWKTIFSAEEESIAECVIAAENSAKNYFSVYTQLGNSVPMYWVGESYPIVSDVNYEKVYDFVKATFCVNNQNVNVAGFSKLLNASEIQITQMGKSETVPYERFWFVFIDDCPGAGWAHPCRYVYLSEDLSSFTVLYRMWDPRVTCIETGELIYFDKVDAKEQESETIQDIRNSIVQTLSTMASDAISYSGDVSKSHFVLISGGQDYLGNGIRFWADTAMFYSTLTLKYKVPKNQIHVYISDGTSSGLDANLGTYEAWNLVSSPLDLDGDGIGDVDGAATRSNVQNIFSTLKNTLTSDDQLVVFMRSHGGPDGVGGRKNYDSLIALYSSDGRAMLYDDELQAWTKGIKCPIAFMIGSCYSGGMIDDITQTSNRVVLASANHFESSYGRVGAGVWGNNTPGKTYAGGFFTVPLIAAFRGAAPKGGECIVDRSKPQVSAYPWEDGFAVDAAAMHIADGKVSVAEAALFAVAHDQYCCPFYDSCDGGCQSDYTVEHPQMGESTSGLAGKLFLVKMATPPSAPTISSISAVVNNRVTVYWNTVSGATRYDLYRSTTSTRPSSPYKTNVTSPYTDTAVTAGTRYYYWVAAVNSAGTSFSAYKNAVCIGPPATPVISVSSTTSDCLKISWDAVSGATSYNLFRSETTKRPVAIYKKGVTSPYMDLEIVPGKKYYYWVAAVNDHGSSYSSYKSGTPSSAFTYTVINGNTVAGGETIITGFANKNATGSLVIPSTLGGWPVRTIDEYVFANCTGLTSITLPSSLTEIGEGAFMRCSGLKTITIPANVASIGDAAFAGCSSLTSFVVDEDNLSYSASGGVLYNRGESQVVAVAGGVTSVSLDGSVKKILPWAFNECQKITTVEIPRWVTSIGEGAFASCTGLKTIKFKGAPPSVGSSCFEDVIAEGYYYPAYATAWEKVISAAKWNDLSMSCWNTSGEVSYNYELSADGKYAIITGINRTVLEFSGKLTIPSVLDGKPVVAIGDDAFYDYDGLTAVILPSTITTIGKWAFGGSGLKTLTLPQGLKTVEDYAFTYCHSLTSVTIPSSVTSIGSWSFDCENLNTVIFEGVPPSAPYYSFPTTYEKVNGEFVAMVNVNGYYTVEHESAWKKVIVDGRWNRMKMQSLPLSKIVKYQVNTDKKGVTILGWVKSATALAGAITIPSKIDGLPVTSIAANAFKGYKSITSVTLPSTLTSIGESAFEGCSGLTSVTIPAKVKTIPYKAFYGCKGLKSITISKGVQKIMGRAFENCTGLATLTIPSGVTTLGGYTFSGCTGIKTLSIPSTITSVTETSFNKVKPSTLTAPKIMGGMTTSALTKVTIASGTTEVVYKAFYGCKTITSLTIPSGVKKIMGRAFENCTGLTTLTIPSGVTTLGGYTFSGCTGIKTLSIPSTITSATETSFNKVKPSTLTTPKIMGGMNTSALTKVTVASGTKEVVYKAFYGCKTITSLTIPSGVKKIMGRAFENCTGLTTLTIPSGVTTLGGYTFSGCTGIKTLSIPSTITSATETSFNKVKPSTLTTPKIMGGMNTSALTKVTVASGTKEVVYKAFYGCKTITSLTIPSGVKKIMGRAFENCTGLTSLTIPSGVTFLGGYTFSGCTGVKTLSVPSTITSVAETSFNKVKPSTLTAPKIMGGMNTSALTKVTVASGTTEVVYKAFYGCKTITSLTIPSGVKKIMGRAFENCTGVTTLTIPSGVTFLGGYTFSGCTGIKTLSIPSTITSVAETSFNKVKPSTLTAPKIMGGMTTSALTKVTIASGTTEVVYKAFYGCKTITSLTIPSGVKKIMGRAFENCTGLKTLTLPASITFIGGNTFAGCTGLVSVIFDGKPPTASTNSFPAKTGYYGTAYASNWKKVINSKGKWNNLTMISQIVNGAVKSDNALVFSVAEQIESEMMISLPRNVCGAFMGEVTQITADGTTATAMTLSIAADGTILGEMMLADGTEVALKGRVEAMAETAEGTVLQVAADWTDAESVTFVITTDGLDYEAASANELATGLLTQVTP